MKFYDFITELYRHIDTPSLFSIVFCTSAFGSTPNNIVGKNHNHTMCTKVAKNTDRTSSLTVKTSGCQSPVDDVKGTVGVVLEKNRFFTKGVGFRTKISNDPCNPI